MLNLKKEIEFWSLILRDHALFQYTSLSPKESEIIKTTQYFMNLFFNLYKEVLSLDIVTEDFVKANKAALKQFIQFKKELLTKLMKCDIELSMTPTFLNHMINEALEYLRVLNIAHESIRFNKTLENIRLHMVWLPDASGHAKYISSQLDGIEHLYIEKSEKFIKEFDSLFKKAYEIYQLYERSELDNGALNQFNIDVEMSLTDFINFLESLEKLRKDCRIFATGTFSPLIPNHMIREEKYYLYRIQILENKNNLRSS